MTKNETGYAKVPTWLQERALSLGIGPNGIAAYAALYTCADWNTGITNAASIGRIARLSGMGSRMTAAGALDCLVAARVVQIMERRANRAHVYRIALTSPFESLPGAQDLDTQDDPIAAGDDALAEAGEDLGAQDLATECPGSSHPGAQDLATIRSTDLSRSLKADPSGLATAKPDKSGDLDDNLSAVSGSDLRDPLGSGGSTRNDQSGDRHSQSRGRARRVPRRATRAQVLWVRDLRVMTGERLENPAPLTDAEADTEIRDLWPEVERRRHRGEPLDGNYWDLSPRARSYVDDQDLDIDRREAS